MIQKEATDLVSLLDYSWSEFHEQTKIVPVEVLSVALELLKQMRREPSWLQERASIGEKMIRAALK